jgi:hypothetical protein
MFLGLAVFVVLDSTNVGRKGKRAAERFVFFNGAYAYDLCLRFRLVLAG